MADMQEVMKRMRAIEQALEEETAKRQKAEEELHAAEQREQKERKDRQKAEEDRQKAEEDRQKAEEDRQDFEQELHKEREETRHTTLTEYLDLCHEHLSESITIQTDKSLSTQGDPSNAKGKLRPDFLKPWKKFIDTQKQTLESLYAVYPPDDMPQCFDSRTFIKTQGEKVASRKLASEQDLVFLERDIVETPVTGIVAHLKSLDDVRNEFGLAGGIEFHNHLNELNQVTQQLEAQQLDYTPPQQSALSVPHCQPDQVCVYATSVDGKKPTLVIEYKAPHKVTCEHLRHVLRHDRHPLVLERVINRVHMPSQRDTEEYFAYHAERLVAAVISQTFSYMVACGTQYGYVSTGEAFVFLRIKPEKNAKTVYYHLAIPNADVKAQNEHFPGTKNYLNRTAVCQVLAFSLYAVKSFREPYEWQERVSESLQTWEVDYEAILKEIPETPETADKSSPYVPRAYSLVIPKESIPIRHRLRSRNATHNDSAIQKHQGTPPSSDDETSPSNTPTRPQGGARGKQAQRGQRGQRGKPPNGTASSSRGGQRRAFCTQLCLEGLAQGGPLDRQCPNVLEHCAEGYKGDQHQLSGEEFPMLLGEQLRRGRGDACQPLWMQGARGALFRVTLTSHGYTVVGKGTVTAFIKDLRHEAEVYQRLVTLQGTYIPICLGSIDLIKPFYYDTGVRIMHFLLLSWAGKSLDDSKTAPGIDRQTWAMDLVRAVNAIHGAGVLHQDIRMPNLLWNEETKRVMVIDFEGAEIVKSKAQTVRQALAPISPNRKRKRALTLGAKEVGGDNNLLAMMDEDPKIQNQVYLEISRARGLGNKVRSLGLT